MKAKCKHKWVLMDIHRVSGAEDTYMFFCEKCLEQEVRKR